MSDIDGCGSHSCKIKRPAGQGVNGPCTCWMRVPGLVTEIERLRAALREIRDIKFDYDGGKVNAIAREALEQ